MPWPTSGEHPCPAPSVTAARLLSFSSPPATQTRMNGSKPGDRSPFKVRIICLTQRVSFSDWFPHVSPDLVESPVVAIDADESVEAACDVRWLCPRRASSFPGLLQLLRPSCHLVPRVWPYKQRIPPISACSMYVLTVSCPLFFLTPSKHADVNAFLVLAATRHKSTKREDPTDPNRAEKIIAAATAGHVPVQLVSSKINLARPISNCSYRSVDLSDKNPLRVLPHDADIVDLLALFAGGAHRGAEYYITPLWSNGRLILTSACQITHRDFLPWSRDRPKGARLVCLTSPERLDIPTVSLKHS